MHSSRSSETESLCSIRSELCPSSADLAATRHRLGEVLDKDVHGQRNAEDTTSGSSPQSCRLQKHFLNHFCHADICEKHELLNKAICIVELRLVASDRVGWRTSGSKDGGSLTGQSGDSHENVGKLRKGIGTVATYFASFSIYTSSYLKGVLDEMTTTDPVKHELKQALGMCRKTVNEADAPRRKTMQAVPHMGASYEHMKRTCRYADRSQDHAPRGCFIHEIV